MIRIRINTTITEEENKHPFTYNIIVGDGVLQPQDTDPSNSSQVPRVRYPASIVHLDEKWKTDEDEKAYDHFEVGIATPDWKYCDNDSHDYISINFCVLI